MTDLPVAKILYAFYKEDKTTILMEHNNIMCMGKDMAYSLATPIKFEDNVIRVEIWPKSFYLDDEHAQIINLTNGTTIPIDYGGVIPYISARRPAPEEIDTCDRFEPTYKFEWDLYVKVGNFTNISTESLDISTIIEASEISDPISFVLTSVGLNLFISGNPIL